MNGSTPDAVIIGVGAVTTVGIERWQENDLAAEVQALLVAGFPAVIAQPTSSDAYCSVEVDVAAGQLLDVQFVDGGTVPPIPQDELCARATRSAEELMKSLLGR
jgi:hypothetical protein